VSISVRLSNSVTHARYSNCIRRCAHYWLHRMHRCYRCVRCLSVRLSPGSARLHCVGSFGAAFDELLWPLIFGWHATMWRPAIVVVRIVCLSVCLSVMRMSLKLCEIDIWLPGNWTSQFRISHQIHDRQYGSAIVGVSGLALRPFRQIWASWASECSEWICLNSHQLAPWWASYRHVP